MNNMHFPIAFRKGGLMTNTAFGSVISRANEIGGSGTVMPSKNLEGTKLLSNQLEYVEQGEDQLGFRKDALIVF